MKETNESEIERLSYEQAVEELEQIVEKLENNQGSLDESMTLFERGQKLAEHCANLLEKAELRVRQLNTTPSLPKESDQ